MNSISWTGKDCHVSSVLFVTAESLDIDQECMVPKTLVNISTQRTVSDTIKLSIFNNNNNSVDQMP